MLGAIAGDIIASPYEKKNAPDREFELFAQVRGWSGKENITYFPKVTDASLMTLAVARWVAADHDHTRNGLIAAMQDMYSRFPDYSY